MKKILLLSLIFSATFLHAATTTAVINNGNWFTPSTWSGNAVPAASDIAIIPAGITVVLNLPSAGVEYTPWNNPASIQVKGKLELQGTDPLFSNPTTIVVFAGGHLFDNTDFGEYYMSQVSKLIVHSGATYSCGWGDTNFLIAGSGVNYMPSELSAPFTITFSGNEITYSDIALPLHLISFSAHELRAGIQLNWKTANEKNTAGFEIERSADGEYFQPIGNIPAKSFAANEYAFIDRSPLPGYNFYRLKMSDIDNKYTYSEVVKASNRLVSNKLSIYPVPAHNSIDITTDGKGVAFVFSSNGRLVKIITLAAGNTKADISTLSNGLYYCEFNGNKVAFIKSAGK